MILTIIVFFAILGIIVLVHEAGHYITARQGGIRVEEFGLGIPPRALGFYRDDNNKWVKVAKGTKEVPGKTIWSLNWVPLGGFVKIKGEDGNDSSDPDSFPNKSIARRALVLTAGVTMNIILAVVLLTIGLMIGLPKVIDDVTFPASARIDNIETRVAQILPGSPAADAGLVIADTIVSIDGQNFPAIEDLQKYVGSKDNQNITLEIKRQTETLSVDIIPTTLVETKNVGMGVGLVHTGFVSYPWYIAWWYGVGEVYKMVVGILMGFFLMIKSLIFSQEVIGEVYGPVGIAGLVGDAVNLGFLHVLQFTAVLSTIIAVVNYLPFPALDGGRVLFLLIEALRGKPMDQKIEGAWHNAGFALLMLLILVVTFNDIARISGGFFARVVGLQ